MTSGSGVGALLVLPFFFYQPARVPTSATAEPNRTEATGGGGGGGGGRCDVWDAMCD